MKQPYEGIAYVIALAAVMWIEQMQEQESGKAQTP